VAFPEIKKVCVFGVGGVGGYFGAKIAEQVREGILKDCEIYFIARGRHLATIRQNGLKLITPQRTIVVYPTLAAESFSELPDVDLILLCVKSYDLAEAVKSLRKAIKADTIILPLMNGIDIYERIRQYLKTGIVLPACLYLGTHIAEPGVVDQNGGNGAVICGPDPEHPGYNGSSLRDFFQRAGLLIDWQNDPYPAIWGKYIFIAAFGLVTASSGKSLGEVMEDSALKGHVQAVMREVLGIARKKGVKLPANIFEVSLAKAAEFPAIARTSYQRDVEAKTKNNEGDLYGGTIVRLGKQLGILTPAAEAAYRKLNQGQ